jgi:Tfp pilus assembly protein PilF
LAASSISLRAADTCVTPIGRIVSAEGPIRIQRAGAAATLAELNTQVCAGDTIEVPARSRAALLLANETTIRLDQNTTVALQGPAADAPLGLRHTRGTLHTITRTSRRFGVQTPFVNANVEGTEFSIVLSESRGVFTVFEGVLKVDPAVAAPAQPSVIVQPGEVATFAGPALVRKEFREDLVVRPRDAVQWALFYPTVLDGSTLSLPDAPDVRASVDLYRRGRPADALAALQADEKRSATGALAVYRAGLLLAVGRLDEAEPLLKAGAAVGDANAYALLAMVAVVRDDKALALEEAREATRRDEKSASAWLALSFAQQASFQLDDALASARKATGVAPDSALAWARLAELQLSVGDRAGALASSTRAQALNPSVARTHTVLGFAYLVDVDAIAAKTAFERAVALDQADPLPHLGLGLANIREGDLAAGRQQLEIAAILDPGSSLVRSYLGKAYYEERRDALASTQFEAARRLDPNDPTPWFYDAIAKQTANRPVEALESFEKSVELNGNRGVYRSRLLLDQDEAARRASLARSYNELNLPELAITEATKSLVLDITDPAAHRFLSDVYAIQPRQEIARASELLQAQLREPLSGVPFQAQLSNDRLFTLRTAGPTNLGLNEFGTLYAANGVDAELYGTAGTQDTWGVQPVVFARSDRVALGMSFLRFKTDGWRPNNDLDRIERDVVFQALLTSSTSLHLEYISADETAGDQVSRFDPENFASDIRDRANRNEFRAGLRQVVDASSDILLVATHQDLRSRTDIFPGFSLDIENDSTKVEVQYAKQQPGWSLSIGGTYLRADTTEDIFGDVVLSNPEHYNAYAYSTLAFARSLPVVQLGVSYDHLRSRDTGERSQVNPKLGIVWSLSDAVTVRGAAYRVMKRRISSEQGLEPTQVAGFNQYFDDANGTDARGAAASIDARLTSRLRVGAQVSGRDLRVPNTNPEGVVETDKLHERDASAYVHAIVNDRLATAARVRWSRYERPETFLSEGFTLAETTEVPLSLRFFHPSGLWATTDVTFVRQHGTFVSAIGELFDASERFTVVDASAGVRLPGRRGNVGVECSNLFNQSFRFQDFGTEAPRYVPVRRCLARVSLSF